jgi:hypothetical protein
LFGFGWAALNLLWLLPVACGTAFVAAALICAVWRTYRPSRRASQTGLPFDQSYAGSKPIGIIPRSRRLNDEVVGPMSSARVVSMSRVGVGRAELRSE